MAASSRGLPGFLRRSLRANDSEDDDDEDSISSSTSSLQGGDTDEDLPQAASNANGIEEATQQQREQQEAESPPQSSSSLNRQSSEPKLVPQASQTSPEDFSEGPTVANEFRRSQTTPVRSHQQGRQQDSPATSKTRPKSYRDTQFEKIFTANVVSMNDLKSLAWNGIPVSIQQWASLVLPCVFYFYLFWFCFLRIALLIVLEKPPYRPQAWKIIFGYLPTNASRRQHTLQKKRAEYRDAIGQHYYIDDNSRTIQEQEVLRQVLVDVPRTAPEVQLFRDERIKKLLTRILYIWAMRHPASSYVQGINDLAMPLIITFLTEKNTSGNQSTTEIENDDGISDLGEHRVDYDEVLDGRIMESISDERLQEVSYHLSSFLARFCFCF